MTKQITKTASSSFSAPITVAEFAKRHKTSAKIVRRQLRQISKKPASGWRITAALAKRLAA